MTGRMLRIDPADPGRWLAYVGEPGLQLVSDLAPDHPATDSWGHSASAVDGRVASIEGGNVVELTPFGLTATGLSGHETVIELQIESLGRSTVAVRCAGSDGDGHRFDFRSIDPEVQRAVHRLSRHLRTIDLVTGLCRGEGSRGWIDEPSPLVRLRSGGASWASVIAGVLVDGRTPRGEARWDGEELNLLEPLDVADEAPVDLLCTSGSVTIAARGSVVGGRVAFLGSGRMADRRRGRVTLPEPIEAQLGGRSALIVDVSGQGFGLRLQSDEVPPADKMLELRTPTNRWSTTVRHGGGARVGVRVLPDRLTWRGTAVTGAAELPRVELTGDAPQSLVVDIGDNDRRISTRVTRIEGGGTPIGIVLTSGWGQTKESTGVIASVLASALGATGRPIEVVRFDYRNSRGGSWIDPRFAVPGREALGFRASDGVADLTTVVDHLATRLGPDATIVVIGISFSGPFALKVACDHPRISGLIQMMAATDLQDLIRRSTGGIDVVAELDRGSPTGHLDVLGVLLDTRTAIGDATAIRLATFVDSEDLMHRCDVPVLWLLGKSDRFVDPERVNLLLAPVPDASIIELPGGHVPTSSEEVLECVWPMVSTIGGWAGYTLDRLLVPDETRVLELWQAELDEAPRLPMPHPEEYWRTYLLGDTGLLGYEILALTDEYRQLMTDQIRLAGLHPGCRLVDLGSGLGNLLDHLPSLNPPPEVLLCDLASEALGAGVARRQRSDVIVRLARWNAERDPIPSEVELAHTVLASLFLSVLDEPAALLDELARRMRPGARLVVSSVLPDADLSVLVEQVLGDPARAIARLPATATEPELIEAVRAYVNSAADLMRRAELGEIRLYTQTELERLVADSGFTVVDSIQSMGSPARATVVLGQVPDRDVPA